MANRPGISRVVGVDGDLLRARIERGDTTGAPQPEDSRSVLEYRVNVAPHALHLDATSGASIQSKPVSITPTPQARDAPDGEHCVESNRRPHQNADESHPRGRVRENRASRAVVQQHRRDQPTPGAARSIIARRQSQLRNAIRPLVAQAKRATARHEQLQPG